MRTRIISLLFSACSFVLGALNSHAQSGKITYSGESMAQYGSYYFQNLKNSEFIVAPQIMTKSLADAKPFSVAVDGKKVEIQGIAYDKTGANYTIASTPAAESDSWTYTSGSADGSYVFYVQTTGPKGAYYHLDNKADLYKQKTLFTADSTLMWKLISKQQVESVNPDSIAKRLGKQLGQTLTAEWKSDISTKKDGSTWCSYAKQTVGKCISLNLSGFDAGTYAVEFYGNSDNYASVFVEGKKGDMTTSRCSKEMDPNVNKYIIPIRITSAGGALSVYVNTYMLKQNVWGIVKSIRKISEAEYKALMTTWTPENPNALGEYFMYNPKNLFFLGAVNKTHINIADATCFKIENANGIESTLISFNNKSGYIGDNNKWTSSENMDIVASSGKNYYVRKTGTTKKLNCDGADKISFAIGAVNDKKLWNFISKEQFYAVYPAERLREMLGQNNVAAEREFTSPFNVKSIGNVWYAVQSDAGVNNKYTITGLTNGTYVVELYAKKSTKEDATLYVNGQPLDLSTNMESYTYNINVEDGKIEIYEESLQGAGELYLAIKSIVLEKDYVNQFVSVFRGERIISNRSYYINSIGGGNYITSYNTTTKNIYDAVPFEFSDNKGVYRIASGDNNIGHNYENLDPKKSEWKLTSPVNNANYGYYYGVHNDYTSWFTDYYMFWKNNNGSLSLYDVGSSTLPKNDANFHYRMISREQYDAMFPQTSIRKSLYNDNIFVTREFVQSGLSMAEKDGIWCVKQTKVRDSKENLIKITINNLIDDKYVVELYAAKGSTDGIAKIYAHTGSDVIEWDEPLTTSLETYSHAIDVKGGSLILYIEAQSGVEEIYSAIRSIKLFSETLDQNANSKIEWANESLKSGNFRFLNLRTNGFLAAPGSLGMELNCAKSTLFTITGSTSSIISYDDDGVKKYVYQSDGEGHWGTDKLTWNFVSTTGGYSIYSNNENGWLSYDRYIQYNEEDKLSYPKSSASHKTNDRVWKLISQEQYEALSPVEIAKKYMSLGNGVVASWEQNVIADKQNDVWMAKSNVNKVGVYNKLVITGLEKGTDKNPNWYDVQVYANVSEGASGKIFAKSGKYETYRSLYGSSDAFYCYSLPVAISGDSLVIYIQSNENWGSAWMAVKNIVPITKQKGTIDSYIMNPYFAIPIQNRTWDYEWTNVGFEPAVGSSETGLSGYAFHPEVKVKSNYLEKYGEAKIYQKLELQNGTYVLSADVFTKGYNGILYAKVGDQEFTTSCGGELTNYKLEFDVSSEGEVEIGFRKGEKWQDGETVLAVDNFRLSFSDDYLKNPDFSDGKNYWTLEGMSYETGSEGNMNTRKFVKSSNVQWNKVPAGKVEQKVTLPAGAYRLSVNAFVNNAITRLFATVGEGSDARSQKMYIGHTGYNNGKPGQFYKEMVFVVPVSSDVVVGLSYDATTYSSNVDIAVDNFHLVRLGDAENTEITCQIVNNEFTLGKSDALNKTYGWETKTPGFCEYGSNVATIKYDGTSSTSSWKSYSVSQMVSGLPNGWYKIEAQGLYRDSKDAASAKALMFANGSYTNIPIYEGSATATTATIASAFENNPALYSCDLVVHVDDGNIELGVKRENDNGKITINTDLTALNCFKLYYLYEENVFADVSYFIKNPSFETGNTMKWKLGNLDNVKATSTTDSRWDKSYYYGVTSQKNNIQSVSQTIEGLPAGEYEISVQVQSVSGSAVNLYGNVGENIDESSVLASSNYTGVVTITGRVEIQDGDKLTLGVGSKGKFNVDNFALSTASVDVYLYNVEAGAFLGKQMESGYNVVEKDWGRPVGFDLDGTLIRMSKSGDEIMFKNMSGEYIEVQRLCGSTEDFKYTFYNANVDANTHCKFKMTQIENSNFCNFSVDPADGKFGTKAPVENEGAASLYHGTYGVTYLGWSGEDGFDVLLPLIPRTDSINRGVTWQVLTQKQYETYGARIKAAHAARMEAWPILCSARRSKLQVDYTQFEHVYNNIASTAEEISAYAIAVQGKLLSSNTLNAATEQNYVDLTFLMEDADCKQKNIAWNNVEGVFKSSETSEYTSQKAFSGRRYTAFDTDKLADTEFTCELDGLPYGRYMISLTGSAYANGGLVNGVSFFVRNNYGDVERKFGTVTYSIQNVVTPKFSVDANNPSVTIGVKLSNTGAKYVSIDDIRIFYLGDTNSDAYNYGYTSENGVLKLHGTWPDEDEARNYMDYVLGSNIGVRAISLNEPGFVPEFNVVIDGSRYTNKNLLVYKDANQANVFVTNKTTNLVESGTCQNYVITDQYEIAIPKKFTAKKASYSRSVTSKYGTLCLPFAYSSNDGVELMEFDGFVNESGVFKISYKKVESVDACVPCLFKKTDVDAKSISIVVNSSVTVSNATPKVVDVDGYELRGTFTNMVFTDPAKKGQPAANDCYYIAKDGFWRGKGNLSNKAFRAYIYAGSKRIEQELSNARSFVFFETLDIEDESSETTDIGDVVDDDVTIVGYYNANGQQIEKPTRGIVIVKYSDGKSRKIIVKE